MWTGSVSPKAFLPGLWMAVFSLGVVLMVSSYTGTSHTGLVITNNFILPSLFL